MGTSRPTRGAGSAGIRRRDRRRSSPARSPGPKVVTPPPEGSIRFPIDFGVAEPQNVGELVEHPGPAAPAG